MPQFFRPRPSEFQSPDYEVSVDQWSDHLPLELENFLYHPPAEFFKGVGHPLS